MQAQVPHTFPPPNFIDSHTHLLDYPEPQLPKILENASKNKVTHIIINTTTSKQFSPLLALLNEQDKQEKKSKEQEQEQEQECRQNGKFGMLLAGFGVHPCFVAQQEGIGEDWFGRLEGILGGNQGFSVGEIGLDFRKNILEKNPKQLQMQYFLRQLNLSISLHRPTTIHCVHAHSQLLKSLKSLNSSHPSPPPNIILHSYGGSSQITKSLLKLDKLNIFFSLSLRRSLSLCQVIPVQRLLCQTDSPCQNNLEILRDEGEGGQGQGQGDWYYWRVRNGLVGKLEGEELDRQLQRMDTNQPANIKASMLSLSKKYEIIFPKFADIIFQNSLRAFKLIK